MNYEFIKRDKRRQKETVTASFLQPRRTGWMPATPFHLGLDLVQCFFCKGERRKGKAK
jgi:hypothetical protein